MELPTIRSANDNAARNYEWIKELSENAKAKYAVCLQKVEYFHDNIYILWLENDSTRLCYSKAVSPKAEIEWK